ncbi:N-acetyltransferase [Staphylococcus devriesei]|uniref:GNAT family N-acetyltransferase n=1 Tax=Staphylococcus devriesei TaxID=586733 RepID=UPI000E69F210|nr:GNAT family N-acetyltransferase [Staphylococcus devriesei]RIL71321.1 N-acetyltransferase [Staphylococcus devriesei]
MIRKARPSDNKQIAELCYIIWQEMELDIINHITKERVLYAIEESIVNINYRTNYQNVWVYEQEGQVAGCIIAYDGAKEMMLESSWLELALEEDIKSLGTPLPLKEAHDDEWYIETVATFPEFRGQGIATQLFEYLINSYPNYKWSLSCDYDNPKARKLYEWLGFIWTEDINLYGHNYLHMVYMPD